MNIQYEYTFHPVGHGLFVSGKISPEGLNPFNFVYDCGTFNYQSGIRETSRYRADHHPIDLLVISHFHFDHVSMILELIKGGIEIKAVVMPYIPLIYRILLLSEGENKDIDQYRNFVINPFGFLRDRGVENIYVLAPNNIPHIKDNFSEIKFSESQKGTIYNFKRVKIESPVIKLEDSTTDEMAENCYAGGSININNVWIFRFFNSCKGIKTQDLKIVIANLQKSLQFDTKPLLEVVQSINEEKRKEIKKEYELIKKDINDTSTVMHSGPLEESRTLTCFDGMGYREVASKRLASLLLTGDINLKKCMNEIVANTNFLETEHILVPHHGSLNSWTLKFLSHITESANLLTTVPSGEINEKQKHPNKKVLNDINKGKRKLMLCSEQVGWRINGVFDNNRHLTETCTVTSFLCE